MWSFSALREDDHIFQVSQTWNVDSRKDAHVTGMVAGILCHDHLLLEDDQLVGLCVRQIVIGQFGVLDED